MGVYGMPILFEVENTTPLAYKPVTACVVLQVWYQLTAAVLYEGTVREGHCFAVVRRSGAWYLASDETIKQVSRLSLPECDSAPSG
jgi:ubiquitin C-terminal hydrolase